MIIMKKKRKINESKVNVTSSSRGKEKIIDDSEKEELDEHELKRRKAREAEINENHRIVREA